MAVADRNHGTGATTGHVVAELGLGFWIGLLANRYHQSLWVSTLRHAFPGSTVAVPNRTPISSGCANCATARRTTNRSSRGTWQDHELLLKIIGYLEPQVQTWTATHSRVPTVIANREPTIDGHRPIAF